MFYPFRSLLENKETGLVRTFSGWGLGWDRQRVKWRGPVQYCNPTYASTCDKICQQALRSNVLERLERLRVRLRGYRGYIYK
jgi:hypothetical protein